MKNKETSSEKGETPALRKVAGVLFVRKRGEKEEFLLGKRKSPLEKGRVSPPGGGLEENENATQCAIRECEEETGIEIKPEDLIPIYLGQQEFTVTGPPVFDYHGFLVFWQPEMGEPENREPDRQENWRWYTREKAKKTLLSAAAEVLLEAYDYFLIRSLEEKAIIKNNGEPPDLIFRQDVTRERAFAFSLLAE